MNEIRIDFAGNLTSSPDFRYTTAGTPVANLRVAVNSQRYDRASDSYVDEPPTYLDVEVFGKAGEAAAEFRRGQRVLISGRLRTEEYTSKAGEQRRTLRVTADEIGLSLRFGAPTDSPHGDAGTPTAG